MPSAPRPRIGLVTWFLTPPAFILLALATTLVVEALIGRFDWRIDVPSALVGATAALEMLIGELVAWRSRRQRIVLQYGYPIVFLALGIVGGCVPWPSVAVLVVTVPVSALFAATCQVEPTSPSV